jgi:hypothetical protein
VPRNQRFSDAVVPTVTEGGLEACDSRRDTTPAPLSPTGFLQLRTVGNAASRPRPRMLPTAPLVRHAHTLHRL